MKTAQHPWWALTRPPNSDTKMKPCTMTNTQKGTKGEAHVIILKNQSLSLSILDPVAEKDRLGVRYCTGGFIFQIDDLMGSPARGILLSGPTFPESYNLHDGQGAPDAFQPHLVVQQDPDGTPSTVLGIGIGLIDAKANVVTDRCVWDITRTADSVRFRTTQAAGAWQFELERIVSLRGRTIRSETRVTNTGKSHVPFQWYPHPFFPHYPTGECCKVSIPLAVPDCPGYEMLPNGFIGMRNFPWKPTESFFQLVGFSGHAPITFTQKHPVTSLVTVTIDYLPSRLPIWGNKNTFSFEPYLEHVLQPSESTQWSLTYDF